MGFPFTLVLIAMLIQRESTGYSKGALCSVKKLLSWGLVVKKSRRKRFFSDRKGKHNLTTLFSETSSGIQQTLTEGLLYIRHHAVMIGRQQLIK